MFGTPYSDIQFQNLRSYIAQVLHSKILFEHKISYALVGCALGSDTAFALSCVSLKIPIVSCVPFRGYESRWFKNEDKVVFNKLLETSQEVIYVDEALNLAETISKNAKNIIRDKYMVDRSDFLVAMYDGNPAGGTAHTVKYAESKNKPVINMYPESWLDYA